MSEPNWDDVPYLLHYEDAGLAHIFPAMNAVGHGFPETHLRDVTDGIDAERAFLEFQAANPKRREILVPVWYQIPGKPWYRAEIRKAPETIGSLVGSVEGKRLPKRPRSYNRDACGGPAAFVEMANPSPFVGVGVRLVCPCGLTHWAKAVDGYRSAADVPIKVVEGLIRRQTYRNVHRRWEGLKIAGEWVAMSDGEEFPHVVYRASVKVGGQ
ncbi:hypothetical protein ACIQC7_08795 [Kitasatospora sp. NPDC088556]|uniref:hypothetical protein n=1 Tax=Kitasatospora sp. NPDC088556 TaxID=3364076 RepID=UPI0038192FAE